LEFGLASGTLVLLLSAESRWGSEGLVEVVAGLFELILFATDGADAAASTTGRRASGGKLLVARKRRDAVEVGVVATE